MRECTGCCDLSLLYYCAVYFVVFVTSADAFLACKAFVIPGGGNERFKIIADVYGPILHVHAKDWKVTLAQRLADLFEVGESVCECCHGTLASLQ